MDERQGQEVVDLIHAATASRVDDKTLQYFRAALGHLDYDLALQAATIGTITWRKFPSWADFKEVYRAQQRLAEPVGEQRVPDLPQDEGKRGTAPPEWVSVWQWCRLAREPRETRFFPQQEGISGPQVMNLEEYEGLHKEWIAAGKPKPKSIFASR